MVASPKRESYRNVLDLCFAIDYKTCRNTLVYDLISEFIKFYDSSYVNFNNVITDSHVNLRKSTVFGYDIVVFKDHIYAAAKDAAKKNRQDEFVALQLILQDCNVLPAEAELWGVSASHNGLHMAVGDSDRHFFINSLNLAGTDNILSFKDKEFAPLDIHLIDGIDAVRLDDNALSPLN